ncbi:phosphatase PAP2 family protein [Sphingomonas sp. BN140010]|uniref:Phosphatase PAP2 family protein n=1 Tax=Sphingomonas arvum TaxID=2992113 RepID=A0ABT3JIC7_9SPHN|nr:phosphatase PAP2 family protein [Sphingomonas sp. BN140010]MCW3798830.1 phosphatase PAP2 family protein [Sphingomonas sp. BN140010]
MKTLPALAGALPLLLVLALAGALGGPHSTFDLPVITGYSSWRIAHPQLTQALIWYTQLGGSFFLVPLALVVAGLLWWRGRRRSALLLLGTTWTGRALIELIKLLIDRPRPAFDPYPVFVSSKSFPSGHAGNSTLTYLAIALFAVPERWRPQALAVAVLLAGTIGWSRPMLGVHWPTDVMGGWTFGLLWVGLWWWFSRRGETTASGYSPA